MSKCSKCNQAKTTWYCLDCDTITCPDCNTVTPAYEYYEDGAYCVPCYEKLECKTCNRNNGNCDCTTCESCEEKTDRADMYEGRCTSCEDAHMVRGIR